MFAILIKLITNLESGGRKLCFWKFWGDFAYWLVIDHLGLWSGTVGKDGRQSWVDAIFWVDEEHGEVVFELLEREVERMGGRERRESEKNEKNNSLCLL